MCTALAVALMAPSVAAASESAYSIYVPASGNVYTDTVLEPPSSTLDTFYLDYFTKRLGTQYKYGGGKAMAFQGVVPSNHATWDREVVLTPGGSGATTKFICDMYPGTIRGYIACRLNSALGVIVEVLAQGDWVYNY